MAEVCSDAVALADGPLASDRNELVVVGHRCVGMDVESKDPDPDPDPNP